MEGQRYFSLDDVGWREFGDLTRGVFVKDLATRAFTGEFNLSLFRVKPHGKFPRHKHSHAHVLYFLRGMGECWVGSESYQIESGDGALVPKEEEHGYRNTGKEDLLLLVVNFPATR